jgi:hypothetical protein
MQEEKIFTSVSSAFPKHFISSSLLVSGGTNIVSGFTKGDFLTLSFPGIRSSVAGQFSTT